MLAQKQNRSTTRGAHFKISRHEDLKARVLEPRVIGQRAQRYSEVADRYPRVADALIEGQLCTDILEVFSRETHRTGPVDQDQDEIGST